MKKKKKSAPKKKPAKSARAASKPHAAMATAHQRDAGCVERDVAGRNSDEFFAQLRARAAGHVDVVLRDEINGARPDLRRLIEAAKPELVRHVLNCWNGLPDDLRGEYGAKFESTLLIAARARAEAEADAMEKAGIPKWDPKPHDPEKYGLGWEKIFSKIVEVERGHFWPGYGRPVPEALKAKTPTEYNPAPFVQEFIDWQRARIGAEREISERIVAHEKGNTFIAKSGDGWRSFHPGRSKSGPYHGSMQALAVFVHDALPDGVKNRVKVTAHLLLAIKSARSAAVRKAELDAAENTLWNLIDDWRDKVGGKLRFKPDRDGV